MTESIRLLVADDHPLFRAGVVATLSANPDIDVVGQAGSAPEALALARDLVPDVALLDITMPGGGLEAARMITAACPATRVVMLTVSEDEDDLLNAMKAGASGYVLKGAGATELVTVLRSVHAGQVYVAPALAWGLLREMSAPRSPRTSPLDELTSAGARGPGARRVGAREHGDRRPARPRREDRQALHDEHPGQAPGPEPRRGSPPRGARGDGDAGRPRPVGFRAGQSVPAQS